MMKRHISTLTILALLAPGLLSAQSVSGSADKAFVEADNAWERVKAGLVGGFIGGGVGLVVGAAASALSARSDVDALPGASQQTCIVAGVAAGAAIGAVAAFAFPGQGQELGFAERPWASMVTVRTAEESPSPVFECRLLIVDF